MLNVMRERFNSRFVRGSARFQPAENPNDLLYGTWQPASPIKVAAAEGRIWGDVVWTDEPAVRLISGRLEETLADARLSGWKTYPTRLHDAPQPYGGFAVNGRCGPLDYGRGEWVRRDDEPGQFLRGLYFAENSWDGSDFFIPQGTLYVFLTSAARDCLLSRETRNLSVERLSDVLTPESVIRHTIKNASSG